MDKQIAPGVYVRGDALHFDIPEMLRAFGWADTEENRDAATEIAERAARNAGLLSQKTKVLHVHKHTCPRHGTWQHQGKRKKCALPREAFCATCNS